MYPESNFRTISSNIGGSRGCFSFPDLSNSVYRLPCFNLPIESFLDTFVGNNSPRPRIPLPDLRQLDIRAISQQAKFPQQEDSDHKWRNKNLSKTKFLSNNERCIFGEERVEEFVDGFDERGTEIWFAFDDGGVINRIDF